MRDDDLQVLGYEAKKRNHRKWMLYASGFVALISIVILLGLTVRYAVKGAIDFDETMMRTDGETTIVPELQSAVDSLLNNELTEIEGLQGQAIVMEVKTGRILAMAGLERNYEGKFQSCNNFAYQQELGSLMKTVSLLAALETGKVNLDDVVDTGNGIWKVADGWTMKDHNWQRGGYGEITLDRAIEVSSNIGVSKTIWKVYKDNQQDFFNKLDSMSFGMPDYIDGIDGLRPTSYDSPKDSDWIDKYILWSSIGYQRKIAPIQMLTFYNAIANDGKMVKPTLKSGDIEVINEQIASPKNIYLMKRTLNNVVWQGLGRMAGSPIIQVAGKTGTSQVDKHYFDNDEIEVEEYQVSFCGYFPADTPRFSMIVSMNKLGMPASGGGMAGVVFHHIVHWMIFHDILPLAVIDEETNETVKITEENYSKYFE